MKTYKAKCRNCGKLKTEEHLEIYDVITDAYFCNQRCKDEYDGITRDGEGYVIDMVWIRHMKCRRRAG